jgi:hypothetical protein
LISFDIMRCYSIYGYRLNIASDIWKKKEIRRLIFTNSFYSFNPICQSFFCVS